MKSRTNTYRPSQYPLKIHRYQSGRVCSIEIEQSMHIQHRSSHKTARMCNLICMHIWWGIRVLILYWNSTATNSPNSHMTHKYSTRCVICYSSVTGGGESTSVWCTGNASDQKRFTVKLSLWDAMATTPYTYITIEVKRFI